MAHFRMLCGPCSLLCSTSHSATPGTLGEPHSLCGCMANISGEGLTKVLLLSENLYEQSHYLLQRLIKRAGFQEEHFYFAHSLTPETLQEAQQLGVKVIMPLGERALRFTAGELNILRWRGRVLEAKPASYFLLPTFKPSKLLHRKLPKGAPKDIEGLRNPPRYQANFLRDLLYAVHVAKEGFTRSEVKYLLDPGVLEFEQWAMGYLEAIQADPETLLSFDIETPYKQDNVDEDELEEGEAKTEHNLQILRISFSYRPHTAVTIPFSPPYHAAIRKLLASPTGKVTWNGVHFDVPVLEANGFPVEGVMFDGMDAWHYLYPQRDKGLEAVSAEATDVLPWKHLSDSTPEWYSAVDADVALRNTLWVFERLKRNGAWESYLTAAVEVMRYMRAAGERGTPLDRKKQAEIIPLLDAEVARLDAEIQRIVPEQFKPRKRYKKAPDVEVLPGWTDSRFETVDGRVFEPVETTGSLPTCSVCGLHGVTKGEHFKGTVEEVTETKTSKKGVVTTKVKKKRVPNACKLAGATISKQPATVTEFDEILPFNANSSTQLIAYMKAHKHPVGKNKKTDGEAADAAHLRELAQLYGAKHPIYQLALDLHEVSKARTTYVPEPDANDLIHTTYTNTPWTWRFGSRALNLQNWGKREEKVWARLARLQIVSLPEYRFVSADSTSAEAVMQGWFMADPTYMDIATQSIHGWLAAKYLDLEWGPEALEEVKKHHKPIYDGMKVANFCVTGDHEVLTQEGWKRFDEYDGKAPIAEWNPDGEKIRWTVPEGLTVAPYKGDMHVWAGRNFSAVMTPNHHLPTYYDTAQARPYYEEVQHIRDSARLPVMGTLDQPEAPYTDEQLRLMVAVQADGHINASGGIVLGLTKARKVARLRELLQRPYREKPGANGAAIFRIRRSDAADINAMLDAKHFRLPLLLSLSLRQRQLVLEEVLHWDGSDNRHRTTGKQTAFYTSHEGDARAIHTIAKLSGQNALLRDDGMQTTPYGVVRMWRVSFNRAARTRVQAIAKSTVPFEGTVYCVTMPTQHFMMRHGNSIVVSSNTLNYGGSAYGMYMANKRLFPTKADAERIVDTLYALLPSLEEYHYNLRGLAHKQTYLVSPWGMRFEFFDVYTYARGRNGEILYTASGRPKLKLGKDGKALVAALPQHSNGMFSRENAVLIGRSDWGQYMPASFAVHDSYKLRVPTPKVEAASEFLVETLTRAIPQMGGLRLGAEVEVGENWGDFDAHSNPQGMKSIGKFKVKNDNLAFMPNFKAELMKVAA